MRKLFTIMGMLGTAVAFAQAPDYPTASAPRTVVKAEYFFDADPGHGNGTPISLSPATDISNLSVTINLNGTALNNGFHRLYIRTQDNLGNWSLASNAFFDNAVIPVYPSAPAAASNITEVEYFIDVDPGFGVGRKITVPAATDISTFNALIDLSGLAQGAHQLFIRSKDASGKWSLTNYAIFDNSAQTPYPTAPPAAPVLTEAEYFFDIDPGFGNGTPITIPASTDVTNFSLNVPVGSLSQGRHIIYLRSRQNPWSLTAYAEFVIGSVLPVSWLYVKAETKQADAVISWATSAEQNADKFIIEYSKDGIQYNKAGEVTARNNPTGSSYSFQHIKPGNGVMYYRIKQTDKDGKYTYSRVIMLLFKEGLKAPVLFPNPAASVVHIAMPSGLNVEAVEVYDVAGRLMKKISVSNQQTASIQVNDLKSGKYFVLIKTGNQSTTLSFMKN